MVVVATTEVLLGPVDCFDVDSTNQGGSSVVDGDHAMVHGGHVMVETELALLEAYCRTVALDMASPDRDAPIGVYLWARAM